MKTEKYKTIKETLYWSYANLAMAHAAVEEKAEKYKKVHFIIRNRLFSGLMKGSMSLGSLLDDEKVKMNNPGICCYCGKAEKLSIDHLIPKSVGGDHSGDNFVWACKSCNSSKGKKDLLEWYESLETFPPLLLLRRYLKIAINHCIKNEIIDFEKNKVENIPFSLHKVPLKYPPPEELKLYIK